MENEKYNYFNELYSVDVSGMTEKKNDKDDLTYLPWAVAWRELKRIKPNSTYKIHRFGENQAPYFIDDRLGIMVETEVTVDGITHEMQMVVMNGANKAMKLVPYTYDTKFKKDVVVEAATMFDINTAIMRCLTKNIAMHGIGLTVFEKMEIPQTVIDLKNKQDEAYALLIKVCAKSEAAKNEASKVAKEIDVDANGDPRLIDDMDKLETLIKKLKGIRK